MKPTKRCDRCNKPIWDHDYVSIHDSFMEHEAHIHSCCFEKENAERIEAEVDAAIKFFETDHFA